MSTAQRQSFSSVILALGIAGAAASAFGAAVVQELKGDVRAGATPAQGKPVARNQRVLSGTVVTTASGSQVVLRFDDGEVVALHENTQFRIGEFRYRLQEPKADRAAFVLMQGALRAVSGALGERSPEAFSLVAPQSTIGIRGTDFMVAVATPTAYLSVLKGTITATNAAGTVAFGAGTLGSVATSTTLAISIPESALPGAAASAFRALGALPLTRGSPSGEIQLPGTAASKAQDASAFGRDTAESARDLGRDFGQGMSGSARDRVQDIPSKSSKP